VPERNTDILEILIRQMPEYGNVNFILGKALRILPETKLPKPVRNLLHEAHADLYFLASMPDGQFILLAQALHPASAGSACPFRVKMRSEGSNL
jgi:hypothetical protein